MTTRTFEIPEHPSPQLKTVLHYLDSVKVFDLAAIANLFADDDFVQSTRPLSLNVPSRTKEEDLAFLGGFSERLQGRHLEVTIYDFVESPGKAWIHILLHGDLPDGKTFDIECIYAFELVEHLCSHKIKAIVDFVDSNAFGGIGGGEGS